MIKNGDEQTLTENEAVEFFNNYFIELPQKTIESAYGDINELKPKLTNNFSVCNSMFFDSVTSEEIYDIISNLNPLMH